MTTADVAHLTTVRALCTHFSDYLQRLSFKKEIVPNSDHVVDEAFSLCHYFYLVRLQLKSNELTVRIYKKLRSGKVADHEYTFKSDGSAELNIIDLNEVRTEEKTFHHWSLAVTHARNVLLRYLQRIFFDVQLAKTRVEDTDWIKK